MTVLTASAVSAHKQADDVPAQPTANDDADLADQLDHIWRRHFAIASYPFLLLGFPVHILVRPQRGAAAEHKWSWKDWLREVFLPTHWPKLLLTLPLLALTTIILVYTVKPVWNIFHKLVIVSQVDWEILLDFIQLVRMTPAVLPLLGVWLYGHTTRNLMSSFDEGRAGFRRHLKTAGCSPGQAELPKPAPVLLKMCVMYATISCIHLIPLLVNYTGLRQPLIHWVELTYSFVLPFYYMFVFGLRSQFQLLNSFMKVLVVENERPTLERLAQIKALYKRIVRGVVFVNDVFAYYLSWVIPVFAWTLGVHVVGAVVYGLGYISAKTLLGIAMNLEINSPLLIRVTVAHLAVIGLYLGLVGYILWETVLANDESRYAQILISDYVLDKDRDPPGLLVQADEIYKSARHLKYLLSSTETKGDNPALLRILICRYIPWVNYRLHTQSLHNVVLHGRFLKEIV